MLKYWIWLEESNFAGNKDKHEMLEIHKSPKRVYCAVNAQNRDLEHLGKELNKAEEIAAYCAEEDIEIITQEDERYRPCRHFVIYVKGIQWNRSKSVAILGTRKCSPEGILNARAVCRDLIREKIQVHGGISSGIERCVRNEVMDLNGKMLLFYHTGIDSDACINNNEVYISPFPPNTTYKKYAYQIRNELLIAWSDTFVFIEGSRESGAYKIAKRALAKGKTLYVIKASSGHSSFSGNDALIKSGALQIESIMKVKLRDLEAYQKEIVNRIHANPLSTDNLVEIFKYVQDMTHELLYLEMQGLISYRGDGLWY